MAFEVFSGIALISSTVLSTCCFAASAILPGTAFISSVVSVTLSCTAFAAFPGMALISVIVSSICFSIAFCVSSIASSIDFCVAMIASSVATPIVPRMASPISSSCFPPAKEAAPARTIPTGITAGPRPVVTANTAAGTAPNTAPPNPALAARRSISVCLTRAMRFFCSAITLAASSSSFFTMSSNSSLVIFPSLNCFTASYTCFVGSSFVFGSAEILDTGSEEALGAWSATVLGSGSAAFFGVNGIFGLSNSSSPSAIFKGLI
mmetsp:Transcript_31519/g.41664  ORF Transcript_31519/g.41664 Transcript_31519/m.41664 type:complete len:264 (+) Transcript_31519:856-1647(+)